MFQSLCQIWIIVGRGFIILIFHKNLNNKRMQQLSLICLEKVIFSQWSYAAILKIKITTESKGINKTMWKQIMMIIFIISLRSLW